MPGALAAAIKVAIRKHNISISSMLLDTLEEHSELYPDRIDMSEIVTDCMVFGNAELLVRILAFRATCKPTYARMARSNGLAISNGELESLFRYVRHSIFEALVKNGTINPNLFGVFLPLERALFNFHAPKIADILLRNGADIDARDPSGTTVLQYAAKQGSLSTCQTLIARGADPTVVTKGEDYCVWYCKSTAVHQGRWIFGVEDAYGAG